jgi:hypothetical protein
MKVMLAILFLFSIGMSRKGQMYWVDDACHVERGKPKDDFHGTWAAPHNKYGVKCCLWDKCKDVKGHGCRKGQDEQVTFFDAVKICKKMDNMHVCTKEELLSDKCCYTGGKCNDKVVWTSTSKESEENPQILEDDSALERYWVDDACHSDARPKDDFTGRWWPTNKKVGVKCCSNTEVKCIHGYTCNTHKEAKTYGEAISICREKGDYHLCTKDEILSDICCQTGGLCDHRPVWTSTRSP